MARTASSHPTDVELEILKVLWETGPADLGRICAALRRERPVASTTVATMLKIMLDKGLVRRSDGPRAYLWSARVNRGKATSGMLHKLLDRAFDGSAKRLVAHLIEAGELSARDCDEVRSMLEDYRGRKRS